MCWSMKLSPCARKISATSTVGRFIRPSFYGDWVLRRGPKREERRRDCEWPASGAETSGDRLSWIPSRRVPEGLGSFSDLFHAPTGGSPNYAVANEEQPSS